MISRYRLLPFLLFFCILGAPALPTLAAEPGNPAPVTGYEVLQVQVRNLVEQRSYEEAFDLLSGAWETFPEKRHHLASLSVQIGVLAGDNGRALPPDFPERLDKALLRLID